MSFNASATNITALLVICLALVAIVTLLRKRYESNLPLLFYFVAVVFANLFSRPISPFILYGGLMFSLLIRFEFMGGLVMKIVSFCAVAGLFTVIWAMMTDVLA
jgi:hypothetical protein